jgi:hypothetical protein
MVNNIVAQDITSIAFNTAESKDKQLGGYK